MIVPPGSGICSGDMSTQEGRSYGFRGIFDSAPPKGDFSYIIGRRFQVIRKSLNRRHHMPTALRRISLTSAIRTPRGGFKRPRERDARRCIGVFHLQQTQPSSGFSGSGDCAHDPVPGQERHGPAASRPRDVPGAKDRGGIQPGLTNERLGLARAAMYACDALWAPVGPRDRHAYLQCVSRWNLSPPGAHIH